MNALRFAQARWLTILILAGAIFLATRAPGFAAPLATVNDLKIGEVQIGGAGGAADEFVELYNPMSTAVTGLSGSTVYLHIVNSSGSDVAKTLTFTNTTVPANGHFLIASNSYTGATPRDASYSTSGVSLVANGAVYISTSATPNSGVVDLLGWGTNALFEGTAFQSGSSYAPASGASMERKPAAIAGNGSHVNNQDTNNNSADFQETASANPENASSPTAVTLSILHARAEDEKIFWLPVTLIGLGAGAWVVITRRKNNGLGSRDRRTNVSHN